MASMFKNPQALPPTTRRVKQEGNIGSVFATFSGGDQDLPKEYARLKREILSSPKLEQAIVKAWNELLAALQVELKPIIEQGSSVSLPSMVGAGH